LYKHFREGCSAGVRFLGLERIPSIATGTVRQQEDRPLAGKTGSERLILMVETFAAGIGNMFVSALRI
jgi:hypothetical protein